MIDNHTSQRGRAQYILLGAGGFASEVAPLVDLPLTLVVEDEVEPDRLVVNRHVVSLKAALSWPVPLRFNIAIAASYERARLAKRLQEHGAQPFAIHAPRSYVQTVNDQPAIGEGAIICTFAIVHATAKIGRFFHANIYSYVAHDCVVGDFVTLAPAVKVNGGCEVGDHAYLGTGAILLPKVKVGAGAIIGAGSVVTRDIPPGCLAYGSPAKVQRLVNHGDRHG